MFRMWWRIRSAAAARSATRVPRSTVCVIADSFVKGSGIHQGERGSSGEWEMSAGGSGDVGAAVEVLGGGDVPGLLGGEEREQGGDVVDGGLPAQRDTGHDGGLELGSRALHADVGV